MTNRAANRTANEPVSDDAGSDLGRPRRSPPLHRPSAPWLGVAAAITGLLACGQVAPDTPVDCADPTACGDHGTCQTQGAGSICVCETGWTGIQCDQCTSGWAPNGSGDCEPASTCAQFCANQNRLCADPSAPDPVCGPCLDGHYEENGLCFGACAELSNPGQLVPLDLFVMLDRSASMDDGGKWDAVTTALEAFVTSPAVAGIGVGLGFFPTEPGTPVPSNCSSDADCGVYGPCIPVFGMCDGYMNGGNASCEPADYANATVPITDLPAGEAAFLSALDAETPMGSLTPTEPALGGSVTYGTDWAQAHPDHLTFIVLATDGEPTGCTENETAGAAAVATAAAAGSPAVKTFVIGVGSELSSLNEIATAGGTSQAYLVDTGGNVTQTFIDALNEIRAMAACTFQIPMPDQGQPNYDLINVSLSPASDPTASERIYNVPDETSCGAQGGWYYDDPAQPQMIQLCPATCAQLQSGDLVVDVLVGCDTLVL